MSWESLNEIINRTEEEQKAREIASAYSNTFSTEAGKFVLDSLIETFLTRQIVRAGEDAYAQGIRQGEANVVIQLLNQIEFANNPEPQPKKALAQRIKKLFNV